MEQMYMARTKYGQNAIALQYSRHFLDIWSISFPATQNYFRICFDIDVSRVCFDVNVFKVCFDEVFRVCFDEVLRVCFDEVLRVLEF